MEGEEERKDSSKPASSHGSAVIFYYPVPTGFFACIALLLRDVICFLCSGGNRNQTISSDDDGDLEMSPTGNLSRLEARIRREMTLQESNGFEQSSIKKAESFWVPGMDVYTRTFRLQTPATMLRHNEKLIGPAPQKVFCVDDRQRQSIAFRMPDGSPISSNNLFEQYRHTLIRRRSKHPNSASSPIPITEALARNSAMCDDEQPPPRFGNKNVVLTVDDIVKKKSEPFGLWLRTSRKKSMTTNITTRTKGWPNTSHMNS